EKVGAGVGAVGSCEEDEEEQPRLALAASMEGHTEEEGAEAGRWARWGARWGHGPMQGSRDDASRAAEGQEQQGAWVGGAADEEVELPKERVVRIPACRRIAIRCPDGTRLECRFRAQALSTCAVPILQNSLLATHPTPLHSPSCHAHSLALPLTPLFSHAPLPSPPDAGKQIYDWTRPEVNPSAHPSAHRHAGHGASAAHGTLRRVMRDKARSWQSCKAAFSQDCLQPPLLP
ncbi:unnamed protein product, partial [Closterium sp. NIES-64]